MKKLILYILLFALIISKLCAQNPFNIGLIDTVNIEPTYPELTTCSYSSSTFWSNKLNFIPNPNSPTFPVHLNFIIVQKSDGTGNFQNNYDTYCAFDRIINGPISDNGLNYLWSHLVALQPQNIPPCFDENSGQPIYVQDTKIHFDFSLIFIPNDAYWGSINPTYELMTQIHNDPSITPGINIYLTIDAYGYNEVVINNRLDPYMITESWSREPDFEIMDIQNWMASPNRYTVFLWCILNSGQPPAVVWGWMITNLARTVSHELGHNFNLSHYCPPHYERNECIYSIMHQGWEVPGNWLPPIEVGNMRRSLYLTNLKNCVNETVYFADNPFIVGNYQLWDYNTRMYSDVIIENGGTIELKCYLQMPQQAKIIVKPGGKLIVNGGVITSFGNYVWQGIEVQGNPNQMQNNPLYQGYVELKNGARIENAAIGIHCVLNGYSPAKEEPVTLYSSGGIIYANGATFKNNAVSISIEPFASPYGLDHYVSDILNCSFIHPNLITPQESGQTGPTYILLTGVKKVNIFNNVFDGNILNNYTLRGFGIKAYDATFVLNNPFGAPTPNHFNNMTYGISCYNSDASCNPEISFTQFFNNFRNIYLSGVTNAEILNNTINYKSQNPSDNAYGIYLDNCNNYHVEANNLTASDIINYRPEYGIVINNSGVNNNKIYRNTFNGVNYPINAQNNNRHANGMTGLEILCNNYINTLNNDIIVTTETVGADKGIKLQQGYFDSWYPYLSVPAANLFTYGGYGTPANYVNITDNLIYYASYADNVITYNGTMYNLIPRLGMKPDITLQNTTIPWDQDLWQNYYCQDLTAIEGDGKNTQSIEGFKQQINILQPKIDSASFVLQKKMDNGNTQKLLNQIANSNSSNYQALYADLRSYSPYLSDEVLLALIHKQGFPRNMLINLMLINTHVAKSYTLMNALYSMQPPIPNGQMKLIENKISVFSAMEKERLYLFNLINKRDNGYNLVENYYAHDTLPASTDSLNIMLEKDPRLSAKYQLVYNYLQKKDTVKADLLLNRIPVIYNFDSTTACEYGKYKQLYQYSRTLLSKGMYYCHLTEQQQQILFGIINNPSVSLGEMYCLNALRQVDKNNYGKSAKSGGRSYTLNYEEPILEPVIGDKTDITLSGNNDLMMEGLIDKILSQENALLLYPNPATDFVNVLYNVSGNASKISIAVNDITGRNISTYSLTNSNNSFNLNTQSFNKGVYYLMLIVDGKTANVAKMIIQ